MAFKCLASCVISLVSFLARVLDEMQITSRNKPKKKRKEKEKRRTYLVIHTMALGT